MADNSGPIFASERRDTELLTALWRKEAGKYGGPPPLTAFDFLRGSCRFVVCTDPTVGHRSFLIYGSRFARILDLPETPAIGVSLADQLPPRYLSAFAEGCDKALLQTEPAPINDYVVDQDQVEFYRAVFLPLADPQDAQVRLILGSFNRRLGPTLTETRAFCSAFNDTSAGRRS